MKWTTQETEQLRKVAEKCHSAFEVSSKYPGATYDSVSQKLKRMGIKFSERPARALYEKGAVAERSAVEKAKEQVAESAKEIKHLLKELQDREAQIATLGSMAHKPVSPIVAPSSRGRDPKRRVATPVMLLSDWHVEETVRPETVNGLNEYNLDIADACITKCFEAFEWFTHDARFDMQRSAVVWLGGDLFSGYIHEELLEGNSLSPNESIYWLFVRLVAKIKWLLKNAPFELITFVCNDGNHGRTTHKIRVATRTKNSYEWLLYKMLAEAFQHEPRVRFQIAEGEWTFLDIYDKTFGFTHGDHFQYQGGVGGLLIPVNRGLNNILQYRKIDHASLGHFHQRLDLGHLSVNGSMIGISPYSLHIHAKPEPRQQSWFLVDEKRGKSLSAPIWL